MEAALLAVLAVLVTACVVVVVSRSGDSSDGYEPHIREELLADVRPNPQCPDAAESPDPGNGEVLVNVVRVVDGCLAYSGEVVAADQLDDRLEELRADPGVVAADDAVERKPGSAAGPREARRQQRPHLEGTDQWPLAPEHLDGEAVRALWPAEATDVRVAVIDTGIDPEHHDLADQVVERAPWVHRYDGDDDSHGTHVAGIVAANADGQGVMGVTPAARLIDVQYWDENGNDDFAGPSDDLGEYVRWAVDHGADVINMSIQGSEPSDTELTAILYAELQGIVVVGISGNCGGENAGNDEFWRPPWDSDENPCERRNELKWPAAFEPVLSVAAHDQEDRHGEYSSANATVDVAAPGVEILSDCLTEDGDMRTTCEASGTSMAAPHVSAVAALLRARHPEATAAAIREAITRSTRTPDGQAAGTRTDEYGWGIVDPEAAVRYLDEHPGEPRDTGAVAADRTQAAYVDAGRLMAFDDGIVHPVRDLGDDEVSRVDWSQDHTKLVGSVDDAVFLWNGPGSTLVEAPCEGCKVAYIDRDDGDLVAGVTEDGVVNQFDPESLERIGSVPIGVDAAGGSHLLLGDTGDHLLVAADSGPASTDADTLWLVDPTSGEALVSHEGDDSARVEAVAVDAAGDRVAYVAGRRGGPCGNADQVYLLGGDDLAEIAPPADRPDSDLGIESVFFNGGTLYATMYTADADASGEHCTRVSSAGTWRLDADAGSWEQVDAEPVSIVRPVEGLTGDPDTGKLVVDDQDRGTFLPTGGRGDTQVPLGRVVGGLWATPTRDEVDLGRSSSTPPVDDATSTSTSTSTSTGPAAETTEAAIARYEEFLHALGAEDLDTVCEIAGPVAELAEEDGFTCESGYTMVFGMITDEQAAALRTATVDPNLVEERGSGEVYIPVEAVVADVTFDEDNLGSYTLRFQDGDWFIVG